MSRKLVLAISLVIVLIGALGATIRTQRVGASGTIYIRADGSIDPPTALIQRDRDTYAFTGNITEPIIVEKDNIVIEGAGYTLQGVETGTGITLSYRNNVTIKNTQIKAFHRGIFIFNSSCNTISGNKIIANSIQGIWLRYSSNNNSIIGNEVANNGNGITLCWNSSYNTVFGNNLTNNLFGIYVYESSYNIIHHNNLIDNDEQVHPNEAANTWDDGYPSGGNYWSDYTGEDDDGDGIGDPEYVIDANNRDRYPLIIPWGEIPLKEGVSFWMHWWFWTIIVAVIIALAGAVYFLKRKR